MPHILAHNIIVSFTFIPLQSFSLFSVFIACFITETKGKTLEEIADLFAENYNSSENIAIMKTFKSHGMIGSNLN